MKLYEKLLVAADSVKAAFESIPEIAVMLGTGQNEIFDLSDKQSLKYCDIPYFPKPANPSHSGVLYNDGRALYFSGRCHFYEGHSAEDTAFYVLLLKQLGCRVLIITNAAGGVNKKFKVGDIMFITDHIKLCCQSPFIGECDERLGERFFDMSGVYDQKLLKHSFEIAQNLGIPVQRGVYMYFSGPQYETPAEVRAARILGADAVGMSTVFEAIAAARSEIPVLGISVITNMASGIQNERLSDKHVVENAKKAADSLRNIINEVIETYYEK